MIKNPGLILTIVLAVLIIVAAGSYVYVNFIDQPQQIQFSNDNDTTPTENNRSDDTISDETGILSLSYNGSQWNFSLSDLEAMKNYTGSGRFIKTTLLPDEIVLGDIYEYTGVRIKTLFEEVPSLPDNYSIIISASDEYSFEYSFNEIKGIVDVYDSNGTLIANESVVMILAYMENGLFYTEIDPDFSNIGPYRIAFVGNNIPITPSNLWTKKVVSIEINPQP